MEGEGASGRCSPDWTEEKVKSCEIYLAQKTCKLENRAGKGRHTDMAFGGGKRRLVISDEEQSNR